MSARSDDDALSWDGDDDPTLDLGDATPRSTAGEAVSMDELVADAAAHSGEEPPAIVPAVDIDPDHDAEPDGLGSLALVALGLLAGAYISYAIGWSLAGFRLLPISGVLVSPLAFTGAWWAATAAPLVWFIAAFTLTRHSRTWVRFAWLVAGVVLLVPWPFLLTGAIA